MGTQDMKNAISSCDALYFLSCVGGLQVWPPNQAHTARLDEVARIAASISQWGHQRPQAPELRELLNTIVPTDGTIGLLEDPLTGLFTDNAVFLKSNFTCYPGINQDGPWMLKILGTSIFMNTSAFPQPFLQQVASASRAILALSHEIASRLGHPRYMDSPDTCRSDIGVPDDETLQRYSQAVVFSEEQLNSCLSRVSAGPNSLAPFTIEFGTLKNDEEHPDKNPIILKPLIQMRNKLIAVSPGSIVHAVRHFILRSARESKVLRVVAEKFRQTLWSFVREHMRLASLGPLDCPLPPESFGAPVEEGLFAVDSDKVAYIQLIADDLSNFKPEEPCGSWECEDLGQAVEKRAASVVEWLTAGGNSYCRSVLVIYVLGSMGRDIFIAIQNEPPDSRVLVLSAQDLEVIIQLRESDHLALWKFSEADRALRQKSQVLSPNFLDLYAVYKSHNDSFCLSAEPMPDFGVVPVGEARSLRIKAARQADVHFSPRFGPVDAMLVTRLEEDEAIPIFYPEMGIGKTLDRLVEGYVQPIWIECNDRAQENSQEVWSLHVSMANTLAYWLWQLTPSLRPHLIPVGVLPIRINFQLKNPEAWLDINCRSKTQNSALPQCETSVNRRNLFLEVPVEMAAVVYASDNRGETSILDGILSGLGDMLVGHGFENTLTKDERQMVLDRHAPLGRKKKLVRTTTVGRASLVPKGLVPFRTLQSYNVEQQLDDLVNELKCTPPSGILADVEQCKSVCGELVDIYLSRLKELLSKFSWESLLTTFVAQHEAYCHRRVEEELATPTNIECYGDIIPRLQWLISDRMNAEYAAEALRLLIEVVSAEPPQGNRSLSMEDLDTLVAVAYHLINWAILSDHIALGILDYRLSILASGRIGVEKIGPQEVWDPFIKAKTVEGVEEAIREFDRRFVIPSPDEHESAGTTAFDPAFKAEFGLTLADIADFHRFFTGLGFMQDSSAASLPVSHLPQIIARDLGWPDDKIRTALDLFTLRPRPKWEKAPAGFFAREDIWPWRHNRRLSYLRRPLVKGPGSDQDAVIFWGPRHVDEALRHLFGLVYTGRYKKQSDTSKEMADLISSLRKEASEKFVGDVVDWLNSQTGWTTKQEVKIGPGEVLEAPKDLGDVDVLCLDIRHRRILSIECKNVNFARNPREIANELERSILGEKEPEDSWVGMHQKRHQWLEGNCAAVQAAFRLAEIPLFVKSFVITSAEIPSAYVRNMPLPFLSFSYLQRQGIRALEEAAEIEERSS